MTESWTDDEFLSYMSHHSRTDRALFSKAHAVRLCTMAGNASLLVFLADYSGDFIAIHADTADPLVAKARQALAAEMEKNR